MTPYTPTLMEINVNHRYRLTWTFEAHEAISAEQIREQGLGGCDAAILISILYPEGGSYSFNYTSYDGRNDKQSLPPAEEWKAWMMMTMALARNERLDPGRRELAKAAADLLQSAVFGKKGS